MIRTSKHLAFELKVELSEINHILNNIGSFYYQKETIKKNEKDEPKIKNGVIQKRVLNPSIKRLKVIQKRLQSNILQKLEIPEYAFGAIKGKDNISNAKKHQGKKYIFTTDLTNFFPSVNHRQVFEMYLSFDFSPTVARYLTKLTTYKGKLPQGAPTSPIVANLVFVKTGKRLQEFATENKLTFTSFVDDLTFSSPVDFKDKTQFILDAVIADGFKISHKKTNYKSKLPTVTGIIVKNNNLDLPREFKNKLKDKTQTKERLDGLERYHNRVINYGKKKNASL
ncbi:MAG: reverse transcriptase family protein [Bacteroidota bacterium]|nr:reverse transcriptase family protein [Bacteroidota bacterium]